MAMKSRAIANDVIVIDADNPDLSKIEKIGKGDRLCAPLQKAAIKDISDMVHFHRQTFELGGLVSHMGAGNDGHFMLHVKRAKEWVTFDDAKQKVTSIGATETVAIAALFYVEGKKEGIFSQFDSMDCVCGNIYSSFILYQG